MSKFFKGLKRSESKNNDEDEGESKSSSPTSSKSAGKSRVYGAKVSHIPHIARRSRPPHLPATLTPNIPTILHTRNLWRAN